MIANENTPHSSMGIHLKCTQWKFTALIFMMREKFANQ